LILAKALAPIMRLSSAFFVTALTLWGIAWGNDRLIAWRDSTLLPPLRPQVADEVRAQDGQLLRAWQVEDGRWRLALPLDEVDPLFLEMLIAYEDRRFQSHNGVDLWAASRAVLQAVNAGALRSGASTLTMQVARLLENSGTGAIWGKIRQVRLALALEQQLSKDEILQLYLLLAPYGGNLEGLRAASLSWLGKEPKRLTPSEAALLVALPQSPENRRPDRHPEAARQARDRVLARATASGVISLEAAQSAMTEPVPSARRPSPRSAPISPSPTAPQTRSPTPSPSASMPACSARSKPWPAKRWRVSRRRCKSPSSLPSTSPAPSAPRSGRPISPMRPAADFWI